MRYIVPAAAAYKKFYRKKKIESPKKHKSF